ncbi:hypothetical protein IID62_05575 [candidate division KSB1 bacterium]|nr:hypothetical protein [candidate division KSB1 bacterium]
MAFPNHIVTTHVAGRGGSGTTPEKGGSPGKRGQAREKGTTRTTQSGYMQHSLW